MVRENAREEGLNLVMSVLFLVGEVSWVRARAFVGLSISGFTVCDVLGTAVLV